MYRNVSYTNVPPKNCPLCNGPLYIVEDGGNSFITVCETTITRWKDYYKHSSHYRFVLDDERNKTFESFKKGNAKISITQYSGYRNESVLSIDAIREIKYIKTWNKILEIKEIEDLLFKYSAIGALS